MGELVSPEDRTRYQLGLLYSDINAELRRRSSNGHRNGSQRPARARVRLPAQVPDAIEKLKAELPVLALQAVGELSLRLRRLTGRDVIDLATMMAIVQFISQQAELANRGEAMQVDDFGFDQEWTESLLPIFRWIYRHYWRVETCGLENVPAEGRALLVSNHAGVLPWDGAMIKTALMEEHAHPRHARALIAQFFFGLPYLSWFLRRTGQTVGHPDDSLRLLERDQLVLVFPEGVKGTGKPWSERYRLRRFGRGGYVQVALRAQAPIIPISVVGSEEIYPMLGDLGAIAKLTGFPYFPITPLFPWLGLLGMLPLPSKWRIQFHAPVRTDLMPPDAADDQNLVMTVSDQVRDTIQQGLYDNLKQRRGIFY
jgi:1-acyl-sn-glycerol-3-phosphate acyltransferase